MRGSKLCVHLGPARQCPGHMLGWSQTPGVGAHGCESGPGHYLGVFSIHVDAPCWWQNLGPRAMDSVGLLTCSVASGCVVTPAETAG